MKISRNSIVRCWEHLESKKKGKSIKSVSSSIRGHINDTRHSSTVITFALQIEQRMNLICMYMKICECKDNNHAKSIKFFIFSDLLVILIL